jgi:chorismate mutase
MSSQILSPNREAAIWARLIQANGDDLPPAAAEYLLSVGFDDRDRDRMKQLAERSE